ncbi:hypothetical protein E2C01_000865 [Portunus trituberculatus]|uniref:Uncharacterized protein n=1 Tax=Portunus trituberculatus TaxID=210409 RepID=A0A5B7CG62_PORTR|nr:hypothetical protein [Portunus trituberculatus]
MDHSSWPGHRRQRARPRGRSAEVPPTERQMRVGPWWRGRVEAAWQSEAIHHPVVSPAARRPPHAPLTARLYSLCPSSSRALHGCLQRCPSFALFTHSCSIPLRADNNRVLILPVTGQKKVSHSSLVVHSHTLDSSPAVASGPHEH